PVPPDLLPNDDVSRVLERPRDRFAAGYLADAAAARTIVQDHDVAGEKRRMRPTQIEQHAVLPGHGNDPKVRDRRRGRHQRAEPGATSPCLPISASRSAYDFGSSSVSGGRTGPPGRPTIFAPALTM